MARKKNKPVSFDAMVKFFLQYHNIPTKKDLDKITVQLNRMEQMIKSLDIPKYGRRTAGANGNKGKNAPASAADDVLTVIKNSESGLDIARIHEKTGFDDKKLRNIIYRLNKTGKIKRRSRGLYIAQKQTP